MAQVQKADQSLNGVKCSVDSCYFNDQKECCMASEIKIAYHAKTSDRKTDCSTFTLK